VLKRGLKAPVKLCWCRVVAHHGLQLVQRVGHLGIELAPHVLHLGIELVNLVIDILTSELHVVVL